MQLAVTAAFKKLGAYVHDKKVAKDGISFDALLGWQNEWIALEVHNLRKILCPDPGRATNAATILKRRQIRALGWRPMVVPYWEWDAVKDSEPATQKYLND